ncbi:hypothetical protein [Rhodopila globiformis]|uniref:Uncharacterized protein n=1 Tax=Rhodopila globiformis TaxID=1071 RepID=A0A2S6NGN3_RHOGL|nr:hypothetical protein [Rhodopila globiformis]PPQ33744.1 hypothetical protein CCS01_13825 [Rhodopila globiformis]
MMARRPAAAPKGLAFAIHDLLRMRDWADRHGVRMVIRLDHDVDNEDYEEVIAFRTNTKQTCFLLIWRTTESIIVQPLLGRPLVFRSVGHVLENLVEGQDNAMTDTTATD